MAHLDTPQPVGAPVWVDLGTPDLDGAKALYSDLLGWTWGESAPEFGGYSQAHFQGDAVAGLGPLMGDAPPAWTLYFRTDDADASAAAIAAGGGTVVAPPMEIGPLGRMLVAQDPTGAFFGLWENGEMTGFEAFGDAGALAWADLRSPDPDAARAFYGPLLGWTYTPVPMANELYTTASLGNPEEPRVGLGDFMGVEGIPPHWAVYLCCADVDAAVEKLVAAGGTAHAPAFDSPFGRMCPVSDPWGAAFWLMSLPEGWTAP